MSNAMGLGALGTHVLRSSKPRYSFQGEFKAGNIQPTWVKVSGVPTPDNKAVTLSFYAGDSASEWWTVIASMYDFASPQPEGERVVPDEVKGKCKLMYYNGEGTPIQEWTLEGVWFRKITFGELDFSSSEETLIEIETVWDAVTARNFLDFGKED